MDTDQSERDAKIFLSPRGIHGMTFIPGLLFNRYKCHNIYTGWWLPRYKCVGLTFVPVGATGRYKWEAFVPGGWIRPRRDPMRGHLYWSVPPTGTNVVICTRVKNTWYKSKNRHKIYVWVSSSERSVRSVHQSIENQQTFVQRASVSWVLVVGSADYLEQPHYDKEEQDSRVRRVG
jgi:hypothetical protein